MKQHLQALSLANETKNERARVRGLVGRGQMNVAHALDMECCKTARVVDVLMWQPRWGMNAAKRFVDEHPDTFLTAFTTAGQLTDRQRALIARALRTEEIAA